MWDIFDNSCFINLNINTDQALLTCLLMEVWTMLMPLHCRKSFMTLRLQWQTWGKQNIRFYDTIVACTYSVALLYLLQDP